MNRIPYRLLHLALLAASFADAAAPSHAIDFPATGQMTSYTANKKDGISAAIAVPDDGALQAGATLAFADNGDGTITDLNTGLMWEKKGDNGGLHDKDNGYPWSGNGSQETVWDWLDDVNAEGGTGFAGYNDWRMPNAKELQTLVDHQIGTPWVQPAPAPTPAAFRTPCAAGVSVLTGSCTLPNVYWTSTTWARSTGMAWGVSFFQSDLYPYDKIQYFRVRAVRGGGSGPQALPATGQTTSYLANKNDGISGAVAVPDDGAVRAGAPMSFHDNGDGTITDLNTLLVWEKKSDDGSALHDKDNIYWWSGNGSQETVWDWLEDVNAQMFGGHIDWRVPNARELLSIVDFQNTWAVHAAFNTNCVPGVTVLTGSCTLSSYWTSTTKAGDAPSAWAVDYYGTLYPSAKANTARVRAVRGGTL